jgi:glycosyltransferase involved in cell wall biosynthesis
MMLYQDFGVMGGIERYLLQTTKLLAQHADFQPVVACSQDGPLFRQMQNLQNLGVTVHGLPNRPFFAKSFLRSLDIFSIFKIIRLLNAEKPDVVHVHMGLLENVLLQRLGYPVVYTFHGYGTLFSMAGVQNGLKRAFKHLTRYLFQQTARQMDAMLVVSHAEHERLVEESYLPAQGSAQVVHNGMPVAEWQAKVQAADRAALRHQWGVPESAPCVVYFNRLDINKSPLHFVALAETLTGQAKAAGRPIPCFLMAGEGPLEAAVRAQSAGMENFRYIGLCTNVPALLSVADVVVHPASREGFGLGLVEAMAAGVPVVAYDCGGPREILNVPGMQHLLVPVNDVPMLAQRTAEMLSNSPAEKLMLQAALQQRASDFGIERFMDQLTQVYRDLLPQVAVILPVYNGEETILRAVASVLRQSYANLELIVVDDGSTDSTLAQLATVQDVRLTVIRQSNLGVAAARNEAFQQASGEWIAFIDADDVWLSNKLDTELRTARLNTSPAAPACLVYSGYFAVNDQDALIHQPPVQNLKGDLSQAVVAHEGLFLPSTSLVHRRVFEAVGGFKPSCYHEDRVFFIEACRQFPAFSTGQRLVIYKQSLSGRCRRVLQDYNAALTAELSIVDTLSSTLSPSELATLTQLQKRNLLYRFLMYNYLAHATRLFQELQAQAKLGDELTRPLFSGNKGRLAQLSLKAGINFMFAARLLVQGFTQTCISPLWAWRYQSRMASPLKPHPPSHPLTHSNLSAIPLE